MIPAKANPSGKGTRKPILNIAEGGERGRRYSKVIWVAFFL
jgi:hypothetical protein